MAATATLRMVLLGDDKSATRALKGAGNEAEKTRRKFGLLGGHSTVLGHKFSSLGKVAGGVFAGGALLQGGEMAIDLLKDSAKAAAADEKENAVLARQMKNVAHARDEDIKATQEWVKKQAEAYGISKDQLTPSLTKLVTATHNTSKAQHLLKLAMNVSAGSGKSLGTVSIALAKAQNGNVAGLGRLGIATKDAAGKTLTFQQIQKNLAKTFKGDAASAADTASGRMKRLGVTWDEMKVSLGEKLLPILVKFSGWVLNTAIPAVQKFTQFLVKHKMAMAAVAAIVGFMVGGPFLALAAAFVVLWKRSDTFRKVMTNAFKIVVGVFLGMVQVIINGAAKAFGWVPGIGPKLKAAAAHVNAFADQVNNALDGANSHASKLNRTLDGMNNKHVRVKVDIVQTVLGRGKGNAQLPKKGSVLGALSGGSGGRVIGGDGGGLSMALTNDGVSMMTSLVKGIDRGKVKLNTAMTKVQGYISTWGSKLADLLSKRSDIISGFQSMTSSVFGQDFTDQLTGAGPSVNSLISFQQAQMVKAQQLQADIAKVASMGLSKALISQLANSGDTGAANLHALASGSAGDISQLNALDAATSAALSKAGGIAGNSVYGSQISAAQANVATANAIEAALDRWAKKQDKNTIVELHIGGNVLRASLLELKRRGGGKPLGIS